MVPVDELVMLSIVGDVEEVFVVNLTEAERSCALTSFRCAGGAFSDVRQQRILGRLASDLEVFSI